MNNMEQLLRDTIGPALDDYISIGARLYENIDNNRRVCIRFEQGRIYDQYDAIAMCVIDKNDGVIDRQTIPFAEIFQETSPTRTDSTSTSGRKTESTSGMASLPQGTLKHCAMRCMTTSASGSERRTP